MNGSFGLMLFRVSKFYDNSFLYDDYTDFEIVPKLALNEANLILKVKNSTNLLNRMGSIEHYHVKFVLFFKNLV